MNWRSEAMPWSDVPHLKQDKVKVIANRISDLSPAQVSHRSRPMNLGFKAVYAGKASTVAVVAVGHFCEVTIVAHGGSSFYGTVRVGDDCPVTDRTYGC
jgi:hypothetical protein